MAAGNFALQDLLKDLNKVFSGSTKCNWLKCILHDILKGDELSPEEKSAMQLFRPLCDDGIGLISTTDVEILLEIAKLTDQHSAKTRIGEYKKNTQGYNGNSVERITPFRRALYRALRHVSTTELADIAAYYYQDSKDFRDVWHFVFYLETHDNDNLLLDSTRVKTERFAKLLNGIAKSNLQVYIDSLPPVQTTTGPPSGSESVASRPASEGQSTKVSWTSVGTVLSSEDYQQLVVKVSYWWKRYGKINKLKVIIGQFKSKLDQSELETNKDPYKLFELLRVPGIIGPSNVDVLIEAVVIGEMGSLDEKLATIRKWLPKFPGFREISIPKYWDHRRKLIEFGRDLGTEEKTLIGRLLELDEEPEDTWMLILQLEKKRTFSDKEKLAKFIKLLKDNEMDHLAAKFE